MKGFPDLPPIWWAGAIAIIHLGRWLLPDWHVQIGVLGILSAAFFYGALAVIAWSALWFWRKRTPIEPHHTPKELIIEGPFKLSRNPIYLALVMLAFASSLQHGSVIGAICTFGLWFVLDRRFASHEEKLLRQEFGTDALEYIAKTRRWL